MTPVSAPAMEDANDTEITLGTGKMLALFFGLVILCAVFFGMGYSMGRNSVRSGPELLPSPTPSGTRASTSSQGPASRPAPKSQTAVEPSSPSSSDNSFTAAPATNAAPASSDQTSPQGNGPSNAQTPAPGTGYFVQVAAVSKQEDAEALVEALKARQYQAFIANQPSDKLFRVQVGPFTEIKDAENLRAKLVSDGYNPILKK